MTASCNQANNSGILLLAKPCGITSFASLGVAKKVLSTGRVGHTGTLDSFAQGLLVVCTGYLTHLAALITKSRKSYSAVICFMSETDTLDPTGNVVRTAPAPTKAQLEQAVSACVGESMQTPPLYSAIHVNGRRASSIARSGGDCQLAKRPITVYSATIQDTITCSGLVQYALVRFCVSSGTYIRSLARDIAAECGSAAHLVGLCRDSVGHFKLEDAAFAKDLHEFSIETAIAQAKSLQPIEQAKSQKPKRECSQYEQDQIKTHLSPFSQNIAASCGLKCLLLKQDALESFLHGKKLSPAMFTTPLLHFATGEKWAVFSPSGVFCGMIHSEEYKLAYTFVTPLSQ